MSSLEQATSSYPEVPPPNDEDLQRAIEIANESEPSCIYPDPPHIDPPAETWD
jgi:hypothetical protein